MTTKVRTKKQRNGETLRPPGAGAEAAALATAAGMMALGLAQQAEAADNAGVGRPTMEGVAPVAQTTPEPQLDLATVDVAQVVAPPVGPAPAAATTPVAPVALAPVEAAAPLANIAIGGSAPLQGGEKMIDPAAIMNGGVGGHGLLQTSMETTLAQTLSTLGHTLDGLSVALHGAVQTLPVAPLLQGAVGGVQGAIAQVSELLGQTAQGVTAPVNDLASSLIGALDPPQITAALDALATPVKLPGELLDGLSGLDGLPGLGPLGGTDLATHGLELLGAAPAPLVGLVGLSYAESIDPFDASHTPLGGVLHGLV